jgi:hypothetical protein
LNWSASYATRDRHGGSGHNHIDISAAHDEQTSRSFQTRTEGRHLARIGLDLVPTRLHHTISRTWAAAALATVIGGPAVGFTGVVPPWARTTGKLSQMNGNNGWKVERRHSGFASVCDARLESSHSPSEAVSFGATTATAKGRRIFSLP